MLGSNVEKYGADVIPRNIKLLTQKQKLLSSAVSETKEKLATLKTAAEQANQALAKNHQ